MKENTENLSLREQFKQFLDTFLEEHRICFYNSGWTDINKIIVAKTSLNSPDSAIFDSFLKKYKLSDEAKNFDELTQKFIKDVEQTLSNLKRYKSIKQIEKKEWFDDSLVGICVGNDAYHINLAQFFS